MVVREMILTPLDHYEALASDIMRKIMSDNLMGVIVKDCDVGGDADVLERSVQLNWSSQAQEQISACIAEYLELNEEG